MTGGLVVVVMGSAVIIGYVIGRVIRFFIGVVLDKIGQPAGKHRKPNRVVRSTLPLMLPWLVVIAATLPNATRVDRAVCCPLDMSGTIGGQLGGDVR